MPPTTSINKAMAMIKGNDPSKLLGLTVGPSNTVVTPGIKIPKADAQSPPSLSLPTGGINTEGKTFLVVALDLDAPYQSVTVLGPILHWIQPGLTPTTSPENGGRIALSSQDTPFIANYIGPAPPPPSGPHRYVFFLYEQPADFDIERLLIVKERGKPVGNGKRIRYNLEAFEQKAGLGEIVAGNFFVSN